MYSGKLDQISNSVLVNLLFVWDRRDNSIRFFLQSHSLFTSITTFQARSRSLFDLSLLQPNICTSITIFPTTIIHLHCSYKHLYPRLSIYPTTHFSADRHHRLPPTMAKKQTVTPSNSRTSRSSVVGTTASDPPSRGNRKPVNATKPKTITKGQDNWLRFQSKTVSPLHLILW